VRRALGLSGFDLTIGPQVSNLVSDLVNDRMPSLMPLTFAASHKMRLALGPVEPE